MTDLQRELSKATPDDATLERVWRGVQRPARSPARPLIWAVAAASIVLGAAGTWLAVRPSTPSLPRLELTDGAWVELEGAARVTPVGPRTLAQAGGAARFKLSGGGWVVNTRHLRLDVASAEFRTELGDLRDSVMVTRGELVVRSPGAAPLTLREGQSFSTSGVSWEPLARRGDFRAAWDLLGEAGIRALMPSSTAEQQLLLADVAQAGGARELSLETLSAIASGPDAGSERGLAAFTLGRRLRQAGRAADARRAFELSLTLPLPPELADEARREVESAASP